MQVYRFRDERSQRTALTRDPAGTALPREGASWYPVGPMELELRGFDWWPLSTGEIKRSIADRGVYLVPPPSGP